MTINLNPIVLISIALLFLVLVFGVVRSCNNTSVALQENRNLKKINESLIADTIGAAIKNQAYEQQAEAQEGQIALKENQLQATSDSLDKANDRINRLLKTHIPMPSKPDTGIAVVPNRYINECEGCFGELQNNRFLTMSYKNDVSALRNEYMKRKESDSLHIADLSIRNKKITSSLIAAINEANSEKSKSEPRRKGLVSISTLVINADLPNAIGIGGAYQDKHNRIYSLKYFGSKYGGIKQAEIFIPLSFRKR